MRIDGKAIQNEVLESLGTSLAGKKVAFIQLQDDPVTEKFVQAKLNMAKSLGVLANHIQLSPKDTDEALTHLSHIYKDEYDGVVIQLPLPGQIDTTKVLSSIPQHRDIDLLNPESIKAFMEKRTNMTPPVAEAVRLILEKVSPDFATKKIVILGKGLLVGMTTASFFDRDNVPYTIFDKNSDESEVMAALQAADIVITGVGRAGLVTADIVKEGVILIDAGTSEQSGVLSGDIDSSCYPKASFYTPVPGGVGPVTVAALFKNLC